ncbi:MAG: DUF5519 family protein [Planctomycetota bacterium]|nr:DUF5519 family protein [Planctomycetota bacterium]
MTRLRATLIKKLERIPGLEDKPSIVAGGSALFYNGKEIAHFHNDRELDLRLTKPIIKSEGLSHFSDSDIHPRRASGSQWIELRFTKAKEVDEVVRLVKLAIEQY